MEKPTKEFNNIDITYHHNQYGYYSTIPRSYDIGRLLRKVNLSIGNQKSDTEWKMQKA